MSATIYQLPDLARMRLISEQIRSSSDRDVAALLATDEGRWFFVECCRHMPADVALRVATVVSNGLQRSASEDLLVAFLEAGR